MESQKGRDAMVQHALLPSHSPLEKTPHNAGVVSVALMATVVTLLQVTAKRSSSAELNCSHDTALRHRHRSAVLQTIICAVAAENIRYFQARASHFAPSLYKYRASAGLSSALSVWGSRSKGLFVEHTLVLAMRR
jgi:hypothetical protein